MNKAEVEDLAKQMIDAVRQFVAASEKTLNDRIDGAYQGIKDLPVGKAGERGEPGVDGADADPEVIKQEISIALAAIFEPFRIDLEKRIDDAIAAIPIPENGADGDRGADGMDGRDGIDYDESKMLLAVHEAVAAIPKPVDGRDGKDVDYEQLSTIVQTFVTASVSQIPVPKDGVDGKDGQSISIEDVRAMIQSEVAAAVAEIPVPKDGVNGQDGAPGADADSEAIVNDVIKVVNTYIDTLPKAQDGKDGKDGEDIHPDSVSLMIREHVEKAVAQLPVPVNGKDGQHGRDATEITVLPGINETRSYEIGTYAKYNGGEIRATRKTDPVIDGDIEAAGWTVARDGISAVIPTQGDDPREITIACMLTSGTEFVTTFKLPTPMYQQIWRQGEYSVGDIVTWDGSSWYCQERTEDKPGTSDKWRLMVKRGRDGKDGKDFRDDETKTREPVRTK